MKNLIPAKNRSRKGSEKSGTDRKGQKFATGILILLLLHGCAQQRVSFPPPEQYPQEPSIDDAVLLEKAGRGPAGALYNEAKVSMSQGNNHRAELAIERALRIEPSNAFYWYTMGKIKYRQGEYSEAIQLCLKSKSLAGRNQKLVRANDTLIGKAKRDSGI